MNSFGFGMPGITPVVKNIIIINVIFVLAQFTFLNLGINLQDYMALHYWQSPKFGWWQLATHMFMHGSPFDVSLTVTHIFFNMFGLYMFGGILENMWGPVRFLIFYFVCGVGAALCQLALYTFEFSQFNNVAAGFLQHADLEHFSKLMQSSLVNGDNRLKTILGFWNTHPVCDPCAAQAFDIVREYYSEQLNASMVGASGAVFGVLFGFGYMFPNMELFIIPIPIPLKAKWVVAGYALVELVSGLGRFANDQVAHFAHLGGMLFAFLLLRLWNNKIRDRYN